MIIEDLVIEEYSKASIGPYTYFTLDWKFRDKSTANYFLYYIIPKHDRADNNKGTGGPQPPFLAKLESMEKPPPDYDKQISDYNYDHFVGQISNAFFFKS